MCIPADLFQSCYIPLLSTQTLYNGPRTIRHLLIKLFPNTPHHFTSGLYYALPATCLDLMNELYQARDIKAKTLYCFIE